ncbi:MAG: small-conductance mechanosensitive channel MscS [Deferrisomatales bacterium]
MDQVLATLQQWGAEYGLRVVGAIVIFVVGRWVAKGLAKLLRRILAARKVEDTLVGFAASLTYGALLTFVVIAALGKLGIQTASFVAVIGAAGLAVGFALQGSLANFAAGVLLIVFRPFKAGDVVEAAGVTGVVEEVDIFTTRLRTADNKTVIVPNGKVAGDTIVNYSAKGTRRVDMVFGVGYSDDLQKVKDVIWEALRADERILHDPAPTVGLVELADSSVNFAVRPWVKSEHYWDVFFDLNEQLKARFDEAGIHIPFPQRDVHVHPAEAATVTEAA